MKSSTRTTRSSSRKEEQRREGEHAGWKKEEEIATTTYDHPKKYEAYQDDAKYCREDLPYRHITNWFLAKEGHMHWTRLPLPRNPTSFNRVVLFGELEPSPLHVEKATENGDTLPGLITVSLKPRSWFIDRSHSTRGIWIASNNAWYMLKKPCDTKDGTGKRQEDVHLPMRAKFGLVSNLSDMFSELHEAGMEVTSYAKIHAHRTPLESYRLLCPSAEMIEKFPDISLEPFDYELLRREAKFVKMQLEKLDEHLTRRCTFMRGLSQLEQDFQTAKKRGEEWTKVNFDFRTSAEKSEKRSNRMPWGCMVGGSAVSPTFHKVIQEGVPFQVDQSFNELFVREHLKDKASDKHARPSKKPKVSKTDSSRNYSSDDDSEKVEIFEGIAESEGLPKSHVPISNERASDSEASGMNHKDSDSDKEQRLVSRKSAREAVRILFLFADQNDDEELGCELVKVKEMVNRPC